MANKSKNPVTKTASLEQFNNDEDQQQLMILRLETRRLGDKLGKEHPRVKKMQQQVKENMNLLKDLEVEVEIAKIQVPNIPKDGALVHGRINDQANRGIPGLTVFAENENGNYLLLL